MCFLLTGGDDGGGGSVCKALGSVPRLSAQGGPQAKGRVQWPSLSGMCGDGKGLIATHSYSYSSLGVFKQGRGAEDNRWLPVLESQILKYRSKKNVDWNCWGIRKGRVENGGKKEEYFITLMKKRKFEA